MHHLHRLPVANVTRPKGMDDSDMHRAKTRQVKNDGSDYVTGNGILYMCGIVSGVVVGHE
jgi:hypothetical protein